MGVKALQYFVEQHCPEVCPKVSIEELANNHRMTYNCVPVIVVDGMSLTHKLYAGNLDWIYGGQWIQFLALLKDFVKRFEAIGVRLVFFFDGTVCTTKRKEWVDRRLKKFKEIDFTFNFVRNTGRQPGKAHFQLPAAMGRLTFYALQLGCGVETYLTTKDADEEIVEYAQENTSVFAILSQDTDFIIFDTKYYLSISHLNLDNMTSVLYDRHRLACHLSLYIEQLPLFSCLLGNDTIHVDSLKPFHRYLCHSGNKNPSITEIAPRVSKLINDNNWKGRFDDPRELTDIARTIFRNPMLSQLLHDGLKSYSLVQDKLSPLPSYHIEKLNRNGHGYSENSPPPGLCSLFQNMVYNSSETLEDIDDKSLPPAALAYRPIRRRMYGLLFGHRQAASGGVQVEEWCVYDGNPMTEPDFVRPLPIHVPGGIPCLKDLWSDRPELQNTRINCFLACLEVPLQVQHLACVPQQYIVLCCILSYFLAYRPPLLAPWEVAAFIAQAISPKAKDSSHLAEIKIPWVSTRGVHLASLFMRGVSAIDLLLVACGFPYPHIVSMPWNFFDGKLFHSMYIRAKEGARIEDLCNFQAEVIDEFYQLLQVVTFGTPLASRSLFQ